MKRILLPTDFSDNSWNAIFTATKLYYKMDCHFYLVHAYQPTNNTNIGNNTNLNRSDKNLSQIRQIEKKLKDTIAYLQKNHKNNKHNFESILVVTPLNKAIVKLSLEKDIDIVIMGTQGATGAKEIFLGSNTMKVLRTIKRLPVIVVPEAYNFQILKDVIFPTDFMEVYKKQFLSPLKELITLWNSKLHILHVANEIILSSKQQTNKEILKERFHSFNVLFENVEFDSNITSSLENFLKKNDIQLMAIVRYTHSFWEKFIGEPVIEKITFHTTIPVLMLPER